MTLYTGLSIDPGMSNGACLFTFGDDQPFTPIKLMQFPLGAEGLAMWLDHMNIHVSKGRGTEARVWYGARSVKIDALVVEKFTPRQNAEFKLTRDSVEPLVGEGVLIGRGFKPFINWAEPSQQYFMGSSELPKDEKRKLAKEFLKLNNFYITGSTVGKKDAEDAISAQLHAIAYLRRIRHRPTMKILFPDSSIN